MTSLTVAPTLMTLNAMMLETAKIARPAAASSHQRDTAPRFSKRYAARPGQTTTAARWVWSANPSAKPAAASDGPDRLLIDRFSSQMPDIVSAGVSEFE